MTEAAPKLRSPTLALMVAALSCSLAGAQTPTSRERVTPDGPYRSQVRLLGDTTPASPSVEDALARADDYGRALILRQLAIAGIEKGDVDGAIDALERALDLQSLAALPTAQMQANLGQLYLVAGRSGDAVPMLRAARAAGIEDDTLAIALVSAQIDTGNFADAARVADAALGQADEAPDHWLRLAVYAHWKAGQPRSAASWQQRLLSRKPDDLQRWLQLASLHAADGDHARAAAVLAAAAAGGHALPADYERASIQWLAQTGNPDLAAQQLARLIPGAGEQTRDWQWLAQLRLVARDDAGALEAMERVATLTGAASDWLQAGELALTLGQTQRAVDALDRAARGTDDGSVRARALLLLGQTHAAAGRVQAARRALTAASQYGGGVYRQATDWLQRLPDSEPPAQQQPQTSPAAAATMATDAATTETVDLKTVPALRVFGTTSESRAADLRNDAATLVRELLRTSRRERLEWTGPLQLVVEGNLLDPGAPLALAVAAPIRRVAPSRGRFRSDELASFRCAWMRYEGPWDGIDEAWLGLYERVLAAGHRPSAEVRQVILHRGREDDDSIVELQIGIL